MIKKQTTILISFTILLLFVFVPVFYFYSAGTDNVLNAALEPSDHPTLSADEKFLRAVYDGEDNIVRELLDSGVDINVRDNTGQTCLHIVRDKNMAVYLISRGADISAQETDHGMTPLFFQNKDIAELLLSGGADVNALSQEGNTPLIWYAYSGYLDGAELLLSNGADINARNKDGHSALDIAGRFNHRTLADYLRSQGS